MFLEELTSRRTSLRVGDKMICNFHGFPPGLTMGFVREDQHLIKVKEGRKNNQWDWYIDGNRHTADGIAYLIRDLFNFNHISVEYLRGGDTIIYVFF